MLVRSLTAGLYSTVAGERETPLLADWDSRRVKFSKTTVSISTGSSKVIVSTPEFKSNDVNAVNIGGVVSGVKILTGTGLTLSTAG